MRILEDLWYGNLCPSDQSGYREEECRELLELLNRNCDNLEKTLNEDEKETLQKAKDCWDELMQHTECSAFITGFRLAIQIMTVAAGEPPNPRV